MAEQWQHSGAAVRSIVQEIPRAMSSTEAKSVTVTCAGPTSARRVKPKREGNFRQRNIGESILQALAILGAEVGDSGEAWYTVEELRVIAQDPSAAHARSMAAALILRARSIRVSDSGDVLPNKSLGELLDRTIGKPKQSVSVEKRETRTVAIVQAELRDLLASDPALALRIIAEDSRTAIAVSEQR